MACLFQQKWNPLVYVLSLQGGDRFYVELDVRELTANTTATVFRIFSEIPTLLSKIVVSQKEDFAFDLDAKMLIILY